MPEGKKLKKCRACGKEVAVEDEQNPDYEHDCGWKEARAQAEVRRAKLFADIAREQAEAEKGKAPDKGKNIFGW